MHAWSEILNIARSLRLFSYFQWQLTDGNIFVHNNIGNCTTQFSIAMTQGPPTQIINNYIWKCCLQETQKSIQLTLLRGPSSETQQHDEIGWMSISWEVWEKKPRGMKFTFRFLFSSFCHVASMVLSSKKGSLVDNF